MFEQGDCGVHRQRQGDRFGMHAEGMRKVILECRAPTYPAEFRLWDVHHGCIRPLPA
jgi:hypothetical protein